MQEHQFICNANKEQINPRSSSYFHIFVLPLKAELLVLTTDFQKSGASFPPEFADGLQTHFIVTGEVNVVCIGTVDALRDSCCTDIVRGGK